jgi:hypothetical protein
MSHAEASLTRSGHSTRPWDSACGSTSRSDLPDFFGPIVTEGTGELRGVQHALRRDSVAIQNRVGDRTARPLPGQNASTVAKGHLSMHSLCNRRWNREGPVYASGRLTVHEDDDALFSQEPSPNEVTAHVPPLCQLLNRIVMLEGCVIQAPTCDANSSPRG